jgi:hypothetical protein
MDAETPRTPRRRQDPSEDAKAPSRRLVAPIRGDRRVPAALRLAPLLIALWPAATAPAAELTVLGIDNRPLTVSGFQLDAGGKIALARPGEPPLMLPADEIVEITAQAPRPPASSLRLVLTNGDALVGKPAPPAAADHVAIVSPSFGLLAVPFDQLDAIQSTAHPKFLPPFRPDTARSDLLIRAGGDRITGLLKSVTPDQVVFDVDGKGLRVATRDVAALYLTRVQEPPARPETLLAVVTARDGSCLTGALTAADADGLRLRTLYPDSASGEPRVCRLPSAELASLYFKNGRCIYLSDLDPRTVEEYSFIEPAQQAPADPGLAFPFPFRRDRTVNPELPRPITLRGRVFRKGLGVHSRSALTYDLGGRYKRFLATIGVDDEVLAHGADAYGGSVVFQVWIDGRKVHDSGIVTAREPARDLDVPVGGARELKLLVDFGNDFDVLDHADWAGARLIR